MAAGSKSWDLWPYHAGTHKVKRIGSYMLACIGRFNHFAACVFSPYSANKGRRSKEMIGKGIDIEENFAGLVLVKAGAHGD